MPIKLPKGFTRRKSSGNLLEPSDTQPPPQPSFRVLERRSNTTPGFGGGDKLKTETPDRSSGSSQGNIFRRSNEENAGVTNRGSGHTYQSLSTTNLSTEPRDEYCSTEPSSVESSPHGDVFTARRSEYFGITQDTSNPSLSDVPVPRPSLVAKLGERTSLFGLKGRKANLTQAVAEEHSPSSSASFERAARASSYASTTIPPVLGVAKDSSVFEGGFHHTLRERRSALLDRSSPTLVPRSMSDSNMLSDIPPPVPKKNDIPSPDPDELNRTASVHASIYSWESRDDRQELGRGTRNLSQIQSPLERQEEADEQEPLDENSQLVMDTLYASQALGLEHAPPIEDASFVDRARANIRSAPPEPARDATIDLQPTYPPGKPSTPSNNSEISSQNATPKANVRQRGPPPSSYQPPPPRAMSLSPNGANSRNKRMTVAEFERYRREVTQSRSMDAQDGNSEDDNTYEEEDDEADRIKQLAKQRQKQEANMAVYRQQMMRLTGERTDETASTVYRSTLGSASQSTPDLLGADLSKKLDRLGAPGAAITADTEAEDDDDEDIPLGVLQAHGFPNSSRSPTKTDHSRKASIPRIASYPAPPGSTRNDPAAGGGGLPVFAKHLPADPYVGASLVRPTNRESMPYANAGMPPGSLPAGGLVGVIAEEERARALRRGTPVSNGSHVSLPGVKAQQHMMPPSQQQMLTPTEQAQLQMSNSMSQMVQMQMQWMQQMMQMQNLHQPGGPNQSSMPPPPMQPPSQTGFLDPQIIRPYSVASTSGDGFQTQRASVATHHNGLPIPQLITPQSAPPLASVRSSYFRPQIPGQFPDAYSYAPSIAPSERSNVGQPSRYRPVSGIIAPPPTHASDPRASSSSSLSSPNMRPGASTPTQKPMQPTPNPNLLSAKRPPAPQAANSTFKSKSTPSTPSKPSVAVFPRGNGNGNTINNSNNRRQDDEDEADDEAAWRELQRKRTERTEKWRLNRARSAGFLRETAAAGGDGGEGAGPAGDGEGAQGARGGVEAALLYVAEIAENGRVAGEEAG